MMGISNGQSRKRVSKQRNRKGNWPWRASLTQCGSSTPEGKEVLIDPFWSPKKIAGKPLGGDLPAIHGKLSRFREPFEAVHFRIPDRL